MLQPTWTARVTRTADAPFAMVTWIGTGRDTPVLERLDGGMAGEPIVTRVTVDGTSWTTVLRPAGAPSGCAAVPQASIDTDARLVQYGVRDN
jgi:hypothetical protein